MKKLVFLALLLGASVSLQAQWQANSDTTEISTNAKVGIGVTNPSTLLTLKGDWVASADLLRFNLEGSRDWVFQQYSSGAGTSLKLKSLANKDFHIETTSLVVNYPGETNGLYFNPGRTSTFSGGSLSASSASDYWFKLLNNGSGNYNFEVGGNILATQLFLNGSNGLWGTADFGVDVGTGNKATLAFNDTQLGIGDGNMGYSFQLNADGNINSYGKDIGLFANGGATDDRIINFWTRNQGDYAERMRIAANGNVGIGVVNPNHKLEIAGNMLLGTGNNAYFGGPQNFINANSDDFTIRSTDASTNVALSSERFLDLHADRGALGTGEIQFNTQNLQRMVIDNAGKVGIGTNAPGARLDVASDSDNTLRLTTNSHYNDQKIEFFSESHAYHSIVSNTQSGNLQIRAGDGGSGHEVLFFTDGVGRAGISYHGGMAIGNNFYSNHTEANRLIVEGDVGIGTATPAHKLDVSGAVNATDFLVNGTNLGASLAGTGLAWNSTTGKLDLSGGSNVSVGEVDFEIAPADLFHYSGTDNSFGDFYTRSYISHQPSIDNGPAQFFDLQLDGEASTYVFLSDGNRAVTFDDSEIISGSFGKSSEWQQGFLQRGSQIAGNGLTWNATTNKLDWGSTDLSIKGSMELLNSEGAPKGIILKDTTNEMYSEIFYDVGGNVTGDDGLIFNDPDGLDYHFLGGGSINVEGHYGSSAWAMAFEERGSAIAGNGLAWNSTTSKLDVEAQSHITADTVDASVFSVNGQPIGSTLAGDGLAWNATTGKLDVADNSNLWEFNGANAGLAGSGRLGIGTTTPSYKLDINGTSNTVGIRVNSNTSGNHLYLGTGDVTGSIYLFNSNLKATHEVIGMVRNYGTGHSRLAVEATGADSGDAFAQYRISGGEYWSTGIDNDDEDKFKIRNAYGPSQGNGTTLTLTTDDRVGIGTTNPNHTLDVAGTVNANNYLVNGQPLQSSLWSQNVNDITFATGNVGIGRTNAPWKLSMEVGGGATGDGIVISDSGRGRLATMRLAGGSNELLQIGGLSDESISKVQLGANAANNPALTLDASNQMGLGTFSPSHLFEMTSTNNPTLAIGKGNTNTGGKATLKLQAGDGTNANGVAIQYTKTASEDFMAFTDGSTQERFVMRNGGYFGMGTTSPTGILTVKGKNSGAAAATTAMEVLDASDASLLAVGDDGNVGIGTNAPDHKLDVAGAVNATEFMIGGNSLASSLVGNGLSLNPETGKIDLDGSGPLTRMVSYDTAPSWGNWNLFSYGFAEHTSGEMNSISGGVLMSLNSSSATLLESKGLHAVAGNEGSATGLTVDAYGVYAEVKKGSGTVENGYGLYVKKVDATNAFGVYQDGVNARNYFSGNIGIGTDAPEGALHLNPGGDNEAIVIGDGPLGASTRNNAIIFTQPNESSGDNGIRWMDGAGNTTGAMYGSYLGNTLISSVAGSIMLKNGSTESMTIAQDGSVGIGVSTPSAQLEVAGNSKFGDDMTVAGKVTSTRVRVSATAGNWPDYVFKKEYTLRPLSEVEAFINANGHLPNIPKAAVVEKEGQDVGEIQTKLLEKVEELTLYLIEQKKEIEALKQELNSLKKDKKD